MTGPLRQAWEDQATAWAAWARTPGHDTFWHHTLPEILDTLPAPARGRWTSGASRTSASLHPMITPTGRSARLPRAVAVVAASVPASPIVARPSTTGLPSRGTVAAWQEPTIEPCPGAGKDGIRAVAREVVNRG